MTQLIKSYVHGSANFSLWRAGKMFKLFGIWSLFISLFCAEHQTCRPDEHGRIPIKLYIQKQWLQSWIGYGPIRKLSSTSGLEILNWVCLKISTIICFFSQTDWIEHFRDANQALAFKNLPKCVLLTASYWKHTLYIYFKDTFLHLLLSNKENKQKPDFNHCYSVSQENLYKIFKILL